MDANTPALLKDAQTFDLPGSLDPRVEALLRQRNALPADMIRHARRTIGMTMTSMREIDTKLTKPQSKRRKDLGQLRDRQISVLARTLPERVFRPHRPQKQLHALREVLDGTGLSDEMSGLDHAGLNLSASRISRNPLAQGLVAELVRREILRRIGGFVRVFDDGSPQNVVETLRKEERETGIGNEINLVVEAATCEAESKRALEWYKGAIRAGARWIAIKPTALVPLSTAAIATKRSTRELVIALKEIFAEAMAHPLPDDQTCEVSIDSERSDLLNMTRDAMIEAAREFPRVRVKMAMQSYLRDTEKQLLDPLLQASQARVREGGVPLGGRLVCGANQIGEEWFASAMGFEGTPLVDGRPMAHANFLRLMDRMKDMIRERKFTITLGSMNLLTLMHQLIDLAETGILAQTEREAIRLAMLNGMTGEEIFGHFSAKYNLLGSQYTPVIPKKELRGKILFNTVVELFKYYMRRIEELAGGDEKAIANYLGILCKYGVDSIEWIETQVERGYLAALQEHQSASYPLQPGIQPNRGEDEPVMEPDSLENFKITPMINAGAAETLEWTEERIRNCRKRTEGDAPDIALPWNTALEHRRTIRPLYGRTRQGLRLATVEYAQREDVDKAFEVAREDKGKWGEKPMRERLKILRKAVGQIRQARGTIVESLMLNIAKSIPESDGEVNEAMDFINLSVLQAEELLKRDNIELTTEGDGTAVVVCPKNFPFAIPAAHIIARLIAGYRVIVKPSGGENEEAILPTWELVKALWAAGVPKEALIFLPCDNTQAAYLTQKAERVGYTGSTGVAASIHKANPDLNLLAETGGRNVAIIDSSVDLKEAALMIVHSVCHFAGQKCSKLRLVIATEDVDYEKLKWHIVNIMKAMLVESALVPHVDVTPLSKKPQEGQPLYKTITEPIEGEEWLLKPETPEHPGLRVVPDPDKLKWEDIQEIFAPIVTMMQIKKGGIKKAVKLASSLGSLTGVLYSQRQTHKDHVLKHWETGNLYINNRSTGARADQGFGDGTGDAHRGAHGTKTGTPEFLLMNGRVRRVPGKKAYYDKEKIPKKSKRGFRAILEKLEKKSGLDSGVQASIQAGWSYLYEQATYFSHKRMAPYQIKGQDDWIESHPINRFMVRLHPEDSTFDILSKVFSAAASGNLVRLSVPAEMFDHIEALQKTLGFSFDEIPNVQLYAEDDETVLMLVRENQIKCISYGRKEHVPEAIFRATAETALHIDGRESTGDGRVDMITQYRQQSYCHVYQIAGDDSFEQMRRARQKAA